MKYVKGLDTLRALAVIVVILAHWWIPMDINDSHKEFIFWYKGLIPNGGFGVDLFFVLSGFLITGILLDALKTDGDNKWRIIKNFIVRRALRIFPIYYLTIAVLVWMGYPFIKDNLIWFVLYISNMQVFKTGWNAFSHTWSLSVEEQFYLIWPWFIIFIKEKYLKYVFFFAIFIGVFTAIYVIKIKQQWAGYVLMPTCMQAFGVGGFYAFLSKKNKLEYFLKFLKVLLPLSLFLHFHWSFSPSGVEVNEYLAITINSVISIWLIHLVINNKSEWTRKYILENKTLNKIGQVSYGLYLFHFVFGFVYEKIIKLFFDPNTQTGTFLLDWKNAYFIKLTMLFLVALGSFYLIEKPILKLKKYFEY